MAVTGAIFKALTFNGESSRNYGVYITGQAVYNAPNRDVEMITIPGRSGSFPLDHGRYENIEVTYPAGVFADNEDDFAELISDFRNMLCSANGYCRLEDEYNPDEYRMAVYKSGLEVEPALLKAGEFDITFECKPQRYLKSGEVPVTMGEWADLETHTGNPIILDAGDPAKEVKNLDVELLPIQDLHGYDKPWSGGAGTNKWNEEWELGIYDSQANVVEKYPTTTHIRSKTYIPATPNTTYYFCSAGKNVHLIVADASDNVLWRSISLNNGTFTTPNDGTRIYFNMAMAYGNTYNHDLSVNYPSTVTTYSPYENICPITGHDSVTVTDTDGGSQSQSKTVTLPHTVYGGKPNITTGNGTETLANIASYNGETINEPWWSSMDEYVQGTTPTTGAQVVYTLATPTDLSTTPTDLTLYNGDNVISSDGQMTLEIGKKITGVDNPTRFEASPELQIKGYGTVAFNGYEIVLNNVVYGDVILAEDKNEPSGVFDLGSDVYANNGDPLTIVVNPAAIIRAPSAPISYADNESASSNGTHKFVIESNITAKISFNGSTFSFTKGTSDSGSIYAQYDVHYVNKTSTVRVTFTITYNATADTIAITTALTSSPYTFTLRGTEYILASARVDSSKSVLGDPTIIDCENGEAYKVDADKVVPLNRYVDLGTDLPKFATGENPITTTGSITECVIIPRWWKL